ncbi:MAG TPA: glycosyltransferase, partial [Ignavibacteria bacterium]|nr:glycosyltransferase [Ignavibacteria bacterium]
KGKKKRYDLIAPFKRKVIVGYYPVLEFFNYTEPSKSETDFTLGYAGVINFKRGILSLLKVFTTLQKKYPDRNIKLKIAGRFEFPDEEEIFNEKLIKNNIQNVEIIGWTDYDKISDNLSEMDVCFDLRELSFIYKNSLPIKLFEYLAAGKPVIYSSIKPLIKDIKIDDFGFLIDPKNIDEIVSKTERYLLQKELLNKHSVAARKFIEDGNNWEEESLKLISFIDSL